MVSKKSELLVVQFRSRSQALRTLEENPFDTEVVEFAGLTNKGLCVFFRGENLKKLSQKLKKQNPKNFVSEYWKKTFPLHVLNVFFYLHKPSEFSTVITVQSQSIPETLSIVEACLKKGATILEIKSQRIAKKNSIAVGVTSKNLKSILALKNAKLSPSLLRMFAVVKPH